MAKAPQLDLMLIDSYNLSTLVIADSSWYPSTFIITNPTLEITPPGFNKITVDFNEKSANIFRADDLGIDCDASCPDLPELPDGIYTVKYSVYPNSTYYIEKNFIRVDKIKDTYRKAFLKVDLGTCYLTNKKKELKNTLKRVKLLIEGSIAAANSCDQESAYQHYKKANEILQSILNDCNC